jgi:hypothetical protein
MNFNEKMRAIAEALLCDKCLALIRGDGIYTVKIEEYCPACQMKMGRPFTELFIELSENDKP